ncbi:hypothetical protein [Methylotenera mobilis]|uniref:Nitrogen fixation protein FixH n=1 Tax=Methylotenera mobilis (strain JLW8 / ATCC BAA-1282 / DSM 17540) TaxID=583345 RepID=C6WU51_METML|nr:hypothetical protein [Methylotenera mobilis]ACT47450.1 conserved hypothetical protein [Methylotenera mobilis JLW8]
MSTKQMQNEKAKWWKSGYAWLVFGGPAMVVVASLITVYIAVKGQDPVLAHEENAQFQSKALTTDEKNALEPAVLARNHAATGVNQEEEK